MPINVKIQRVDKNLPLPIYETAGSVGFDILARTDTAIQPGSLGLIPGNIIVEVPRGYMLTLASRSSTPRKKGLLTPHGIGIVDQDYCGQEDEILVQVYNFSDEVAHVKRGEKIAQGVFVRVDQIVWDETTKMGTMSRGGFGSTDRHHKSKTHEKGSVHNPVRDQ